MNIFPKIILLITVAFSIWSLLTLSYFLVFLFRKRRLERWLYKRPKEYELELQEAEKRGVDACNEIKDRYIKEMISICRESVKTANMEVTLKRLIKFLSLK